MNVQVWYSGYSGWFDYQINLTQQEAESVVDELNESKPGFIVAARMVPIKMLPKQVVYPPEKRIQCQKIEQF